MLRAYVVPFQTDWDEHLVAAEFAYNNSVQASTGFTPFFLYHGRHPYTPLSLTLSTLQPNTNDNNPAAIDFVGRLQTNWGLVRRLHAVSPGNALVCCARSRPDMLKSG
eukprot:1137166-Pelagomonas_calceolata.AAC.1